MAYTIAIPSKIVQHFSSLSGNNVASWSPRIWLRADLSVINMLPSIATNAGGTAWSSCLNNLLKSITLPPLAAESKHWNIFVSDFIILGRDGVFTDMVRIEENVKDLFFVIGSNRLIWASATRLIKFIRTCLPRTTAVRASCRTVSGATSLLEIHISCCSSRPNESNYYIWYISFETSLSSRIILDGFSSLWCDSFWSTPSYLGHLVIALLYLCMLASTDLVPFWCVWYQSNRRIPCMFCWHIPEQD